MIKALDAVRNGMPYTLATKQFAVPVISVKRRAKHKNKEAIKYFNEKKTVFTLTQDIELVKYIKNMETEIYRVTRQDILSFASQLWISLEEFVSGIPSCYSIEFNCTNA